ncbi:MAG: FIST C-terminal domain-containing protein [Synergistaceae bacterium]|jgi:hypothetical protein|nr:FIST C-terminal domain-containing protein [Synergistaceae bacterium]
MRSIVAVTDEMDNAEAAVQELWDRIVENGPLGKNCCGFVYCDVEMPHEEFTAALKKKLPFEVVGCTSIANFDAKNGAQILSAVLVVLTGDDVRFGVALTDTLTPENLRQELSAACEKTRTAVGEPGKLLFLVPPFNDVVPLDEYVDTLSELTGGIPVFGGLPSSNVADGDILMYADGRVFTDRAAIVLVGGNVRPIFSVQNVLSDLSEQKHVISKAEKNVVYTVEEMTFTDYLRQAGLPVDDLIAQGDLAVYVSTPLKVNMSQDNDQDKVPIVRTIKTLSLADGSGVLFGAISENSVVSIVTMKRQDIQESCRMAVKEIQDKIEAARGDGYTYSTLLCVSCGGRYMVMGDDKDIEGNILVENLPSGMTLSGFYAYGEICPTIYENGTALNRVHNESIVMCAL